MEGARAMRGLLERADGRLRLGLKLFELGQLVPQQRGLRDAAPQPFHDQGAWPAVFAGE